ncbi:SH3 domain-containing protein [Streptomyces sp. NPDC046197]|uniref:SH3 domain-containing protein n=1 Tax=Streptomyces sp. NPDC046197 TaxID=3154337 RepID=UPI0033D9DD78
MIRRTLTSGLLATVAVLALVPTAADAAQGGPAQRPAAAAVAPHLLPSLLTAAVPQAPAVYHSGRSAHHAHQMRPVRHLRHTKPRAAHRRSVHPLGRVTTRHFALNVRSGPGTGYRVIGVRHANHLVTLKCRTYGSWVRGTRQWYRLTHVRGYVSARYVRVRAAVPWC